MNTLLLLRQLPPPFAQLQALSGRREEHRRRDDREGGQPVHRQVPLVGREERGDATIKVLVLQKAQLLGKLLRDASPTGRITLGPSALSLSHEESESLD